ncbi:MAG: hypothetical protein A2Y53_01760 [Chloroflexi bacterium RBG_16_47_49]|nr:MAG: hypothetical protein A2Y53_01760 [Chloroflexi bacterium RBG_16_47_49]
MKPNKVFLIIVTIFILTLFSVACSKETVTTAPVDNPVATQESIEPTQETSAATSEPTGVPEDVPIVPDAYELEVANQLNLEYKVNLPIKDVVEFYQQEFPNYGWDVINNPDSVVGSMAQMSRSNAEGDRLIFSIQYNPVGEFAINKIFITRVP